MNQITTALTNMMFLQKIPYEQCSEYHLRIQTPSGKWINFYPTKMTVHPDKEESYKVRSLEELYPIIGLTPPMQFPVNNTPAEVYSLKYKRLDERALAPHKTYDTDAGIDLFALEDTEWNVNGNFCTVIVKTGIALEIPKGTFLAPAPRSSGLFGKYETPFFSVLDTGYTGEVTFLLWHFSPEVPPAIKKHEKVAQVVLLDTPIVSTVFTEVNELPVHSLRGGNGFGSTGKTATHATLKDTLEL
jgi:dUTP pyrophosphatase